jgi:DNA-binding beta-propeller fold protein YncE
LESHLKNQAYALCLLVCAFVLVAGGCGNKNSPASPSPGFTPSGPLTSLSAFATVGSGSFSFAEKIQYTNGKLWVTDLTNNNLQEWVTNGSSPITTITTFNTTDTFSSPQGIGINPSNGDIYVADFNNDRIVVFNSTGSYRTQFGNTELSGLHARGVAVNSAGTTVYALSDTGGVFDYSISASNPATYGFGVSFANSGPGTLSSPSNVRLDNTGNLWVADFNNGRLVEFNSSGAYLNAISISGASPSDLTFDPSNNFYVTTISSSQIAVFDSAGTPVTTVGSAILLSPEGITTDKNGTFYATNGSSIIAFH